MAAGDRDALSARATLKFSRSAHLQAAGARLKWLPYELTDAVAIEALVGRNTYRLAIRSGKQQTTFVRDESGRVCVWDHGSKSHFITPAPVAALKVVRPATLHVEFAEQEDTRSAEVQLTDYGLGPMRLVMLFSKRPELAPFAETLLSAVHCGPACHAQSGLPIADLAKAGCLLSERLFFSDSRDPAMELAFETLELAVGTDAAFEPPRDFAPVSRLPKKGAARKQDMFIVAANEQARAMLFEAKPPAFKDELTPACLGGTRFGSMSATIHQDALDHVKNFVNAIAPLCGTATLTSIPGTDDPSGTLTLPWLVSLGALNLADTTGPGSGLFCLLRDPRKTTAAGGPSGGTGLLDRIAVKLLTTPDANGNTRLQQEFAAHTMVETLVRWSVGQNIITALINLRGDFSALSLDQQVEVAEGYEITELGTITLRGLPDAFHDSLKDPFGNALLDFTATRFAGSFALGSLLGGAPVVPTMAFGDSGDINLTLNLPDFTLTADLSSSPTSLGITVLSTVTLASCLAYPFACPVLLPSAMLLIFIINNVTSVTVSGTGVSLGMRIEYRFNPDTSRIDPFVTVAADGGTVTVTDSWTTPDFISNLFLSFLTGVWSLFNAWVAAFAALLGVALENALRDGGFAFPAGQAGLTVTGGSAVSTPHSDLTLSCDLEPVLEVAAQPYVTQVEPSDVVKLNVRNELVRMRQQLNPNLHPAGAPGPGPAIAVATYLGLGVSQNVLNAYLFSRWKNGDFNVTVSDPIAAAQIAGLAPAGVFQVDVASLHVWPATSPRAEVSLDNIEKGIRPLVVYFDDVRACFEGRKLAIRGGDVTPRWELSFNAKTTGTMGFDWPLLFRLFADIGPSAIVPCDTRTWEFTDPNVAKVMAAHPGPEWTPLVNRLAGLMLRPLDGAAITAPPAPGDWVRGFIAMQQELLPSVTVGVGTLGTQQFYWEIEGHRRALYLLTAFDTDLLQFVDGSGAPLLNAGPPLGTVTLANMTCPEGTGFRSLLGPLGSQIPPQG